MNILLGSGYRFFRPKRRTGTFVLAYPAWTISTYILYRTHLNTVPKNLTLIFIKLMKLNQFSFSNELKLRHLLGLEAGLVRSGHFVKMELDSVKKDPDSQHWDIWKLNKIKLGSRDIKIPLQVRKYNRGIIISDNSKPTLFVQVASYGVGGHFYLHHDPMFIYKEPEFLAKSVESRGKEQYITGSSLLPPPLCLVILSHQISSFY